MDKSENVVSTSTTTNKCENVVSTATTINTETTDSPNIRVNKRDMIPKNTPTTLNIIEEKEKMRKYIVLERYLNTKSKQTSYNCLGALENSENTDGNGSSVGEISLETLSSNEKNNVIDRHGVYRDIYCMDAIQWLNENKIDSNSSVITSLPDITEVTGMTLEQYKQWFINTVTLITSKLSDNNVAIFYQTDIKRRYKLDRSRIEEYVDKGFLAQTGALVSGCKVIWHKIMSAHNNISNNKASFTHMICFAKNPYKIAYQDNTSDVTTRGDMVWSRGMGLNACVVSIGYCRGIGSTTIVDPFCGKGTVLAVSNVYGLNSIGVDLSTGKTRNSFNLHLDVSSVVKFNPNVWKQSNNNNSSNNNEGDNDNADDTTTTTTTTTTTQPKRKVKKSKRNLPLVDKQQDGDDDEDSSDN